MPSASEIREQFINFFVKRHGHTFVPSSPVVPLDDPTLLFTNAGMNQFKDVFLGMGTRPYRRAVDSQKCIRVSGKHNDLEEVGRDTYHHTFFEMLGNWSFGDYYKAEAIRWAWELLTGEWKIEKDRLHATVFGGDKESGLEPDGEAFRLWTEVTDIAPGHVHRFGKKDNFWMMGETGPCGPCSEIHIDRTPDRSGHALVNRGDARVTEIWNLVFIQYNRDETGQLTLLPARHVDTGMGFERVVAVLQGKNSNYDTDVFTSIMSSIGQRTGKKYGGRLDDLTDVAFRVIADHLRMLVFAITDGALPENKGRGSALRSVLRRAVRYGWQYFGQREPFIFQLVPALVENMGHAYPELKRNPDRVAQVIRQEEEDFLRTIGRGLSEFEEAAEHALAGDRMIRADDVFRLYTEQGFPSDLTRQMAQERDLSVDEEGYERLMKEHEDISRGDRAQAQVQATIQGSLPATDDRFKWSTDQMQSRVLGWIDQEGKFVQTGTFGSGQTGALVLSQTCFYAEAGGQVGDRHGTVKTPTAHFEVERVFKAGDGIAHFGRVTKGRLEVGQTASLKVDPEREFTQKNHTATHLLHWALQKVLGSHVEQRGSKVKPDEFTFDFSHNGPLSQEETAEVERLVNEKIYQDLPVNWRELPIEEARQLPGVRAFFGDKYGEVVRVVEIGDGFSREFCGGTHLDHTGQAGFFKIVGEEAVAKGVRRLTCVTARKAVEAAQKGTALITNLAGSFNCKPDDLPARIEALQQEVKKLNQQLKKGAASDLHSAGDRLLDGATEVGGVRVIVGELPAAPEEQIRQQVDRLRQKAASAVVVLGWREDSKVQLIAAVTEDVVKKGLHAGRLVGKAAKVIGGGGGGKPTMAQAGGKEPQKLAEALQLARQLVHDKLEAARAPD
jgi:alanyl-tRNA synthetase